MKYYEVDKSSDSIIIFKFNPIEPNLETYNSFLNESLEILNTYTDMVYILDISESKALPVDIRIAQGNWNKKHDKLMKEKLKGIVFVQNSVIVNFMMKAIFLIQKPSAPYVVVKNMAEARIWAEGKIGKSLAA